MLNSSAGRDRRIALLLALFALLLYNANLREIAAGDTFPARFLPMAVLHSGTVYLDDLVEATRMGRLHPYWILPVRGGRFASVYPLVTPLLATPLYLPAVLYLDHHGWGDVEGVQKVGRVMEKIAASCIAAASVGLLFWLLRRQLSRGRALALAALFAFGTETWAISSQALWQHGTAELLIVVALLAVTGQPTMKGLLVAGLASGLVIANRPPDVPLAAAFAIYALFWARPPRALLFFAAAALPLALTVGYDVITFGNLSGGYGYIVQHGPGYAKFFSYPLGSGLVGELLSPGKGLFVYSPFLLFLPLYLRRSLTPSRRLLTVCLLVGMALQLVMYAKTDWRSGYSYGPRYLTDLVPILIWMLAPVVESLEDLAFGAFLTAGLFSIYVQLIGAFYYPGGGSDQLYYPEGEASTDLTNVWKPEDAAFVVELKAGPRHHFEFLDLRHQPR
ncbi:MAG TPA: hypothetical protein VOA87_00770 [Thermoanaerobaculia bacterium]|nr:hypothetical protein [Thermoanaerobaculia bacterium]